MASQAASLARLRSPAVLVAQNGHSVVLPNYMADDVEQSRASIVAAMSSVASFAASSRVSHASAAQAWAADREEGDDISPMESVWLSARLQKASAPGGAPPSCQPSEAFTDPDVNRRPSSSSPSTAFSPRVTPQQPHPHSQHACPGRLATSASDSSTVPRPGSSGGCLGSLPRKPLSASLTSQAHSPVGPAASAAAANTDLVAAVTGRIMHQHAYDEDFLDEEELAVDLAAAQDTLAKALQMARSGNTTCYSRGGSSSHTSGGRRPQPVRVVEVEITPATGGSTAGVISPHKAPCSRMSTESGYSICISGSGSGVHAHYGGGGGIHGSVSGTGGASNAAGVAAAANRPPSGDRWSLHTSSSIASRTTSIACGSAASKQLASAAAAAVTATSSPLEGRAIAPSTPTRPSPRQPSTTATGWRASDGNMSGDGEMVDVEAASPAVSASGASGGDRSSPGIGRFGAASQGDPCHRTIERGGGGGSSFKDLFKLAKKAFRRATGAAAARDGGGKTPPAALPSAYAPQMAPLVVRPAVAPPTPGQQYPSSVLLISASEGPPLAGRCSQAQPNIGAKRTSGTEQRLSPSYPTTSPASEGTRASLDYSAAASAAAAARSAYKQSLPPRPPQPCHGNAAGSGSSSRPRTASHPGDAASPTGSDALASSRGSSGGGGSRHAAAGARRHSLCDVGLGSAGVTCPPATPHGNWVCASSQPRRHSANASRATELLVTAHVQSYLQSQQQQQLLQHPQQQQPRQQQRERLYSFADSVSCEGDGGGLLGPLGGIPRSGVVPSTAVPQVSGHHCGHGGGSGGPLHGQAHGTAAKQAPERRSIGGTPASGAMAESETAVKPYARSSTDGSSIAGWQPLSLPPSPLAPADAAPVTPRHRLSGSGAVAPTATLIGAASPVPLPPLTLPPPISSAAPVATCRYGNGRLRSESGDGSAGTPAAEGTAAPGRRARASSCSGNAEDGRSSCGSVGGLHLGPHAVTPRPTATPGSPVVWKASGGV